MNLRYSIRRSTMERLLRVTAERNFSTQVQGMAIPSLGVRWGTILPESIGGDEARDAARVVTTGFVAAVIVDEVRILEDGFNRSMQGIRF